MYFLIKSQIWLRFQFYCCWRIYRYWMSSLKKCTMFVSLCHFDLPMIISLGHQLLACTGAGSKLMVKPVLSTQFSWYSMSTMVQIICQATNISLQIGRRNQIHIFVIEFDSRYQQLHAKYFIFQTISTAIFLPEISSMWMWGDFVQSPDEYREPFLRGGLWVTSYACVIISLDGGT